MNKSDSVKNLAIALKKAQSEMGEVKFDSTNPFFKSKYASLGAVIEASKEALFNNGLVVSQPTTTNEYGVGITTLLMHDSGEWIENTVTIPLPEPTYTDRNGEVKQNNYAQEAGKTITYLRRYSLASLLNLYSDEDNDGNPSKRPEPKQEPARTMSLQTAEDVVDSEGKRYGDCESTELEGKLIGISKMLKKNDLPSDKRETYLMKRDAINTILAARK